MNILKKIKSIPFLSRLALLYALCILDWALTLFLINTGYFAEANPIMSNVMDNMFLGVLVKCALPFLMLTVLGIRLINANEKQLKIAGVILGVAVWAYLVINIMHIFWILLAGALSFVY